jgi:hypothetical protein
LIPDLSLLVQLKSASVTSVSYTTSEEMAWISTLEVPLFIGRVNLKLGNIELFTTQRLHQVLLEQSYDGVELLLDESDKTSSRSTLRRANLGPPVHAWSLAETTESDFLTRSHVVLRPHIETLRRNRLLRGIQSQKLLRWVTGQPPTDMGEMTLVSPQHNIADTLREMAPHTRRLMTELLRHKRYGDFPVLLAFFDLMRRWGADPDPDGTLRIAAGSMAQGPEIPIEDVIRLRHAFQPNGLDLSQLPVTNDALGFIPPDVTKVALVDTLLTDEGIPSLVQLQGLLRVNVAGTKITDDGLQELGKLASLEWVCVNRTQVTAAGVERLRAIRPDIAVVVGADS